MEALRKPHRSPRPVEAPRNSDESPTEVPLKSYEALMEVRPKSREAVTEVPRNHSVVPVRLTRKRKVHGIA